MTNASNEEHRPISNPFDFSNPVRDPTMLAGRHHELHDAAYYLDQARAGSSYSLALIGERASGKTSLLNALAAEARRTGILVTKVTLDGEVAANELAFFREIFESLMQDAAAAGLFGGDAGAEFDTFLRQVRFLETSTDRRCEPLAFGRIYATAHRDHLDLPLGRRALRDDFARIIEEAVSHGMPSVLVLIDEADLLASSEALLQALRNLLMDLPGLIFAMAGTDHMFPALQEVFSPVPRQFVRVPVENFADWRDTRRAIVSRLTAVGHNWAVPTDAVVREVHRITRGNPYEVILVSHFAFRELITRRERAPLRLTSTALEGVARQLEQQNPALHGAVTRFQALSADDASLVRGATTLDGVSLRQMALAELAFDEATDNAAVLERARDIEHRLAKAVELGLIRIEGDCVSVSAEPFERAYIRYAIASRSGDPGEKAVPIRQPVAMLVSKLERRLARAMANLLDAEAVRVVARSRRVGGRSDTGKPDDALVWAPVEPLQAYTVRYEIPVSVGEDWQIFIWPPVGDDASGIDEQFRRVVADDHVILEKFGVTVGEIVVQEVDRSQVQLRREETAADEPLYDEYLRTSGDFIAARVGYQERIAALADQLVAGAETANRVSSWRFYNDVAFMALGVGDVRRYDELTATALRLKPREALTLATRALRRAGNGAYDEALDDLSVARETLEAGGWRAVVMLSPATLCGEAFKPSPDDVVTNANLADIIEIYRAVVIGRRDGARLSDVLADHPVQRRWSLLAAAACAEREGDDERARRLRQLAVEADDG